MPLLIEPGVSGWCIQCRAHATGVLGCLGVIFPVGLPPRGKAGAGAVLGMAACPRSPGVRSLPLSGCASVPFRKRAIFFYPEGPAWQDKPWENSPEGKAVGICPAAG